ncbi:unnamed protein product [Paramecium sonneborni]|uniref:phosphoinositide phospholipase C n=1 Tax=Paramecium sonneborni TaxID=65129 RepID=A0A8S1LM56_9CILI|nr:unnamed protein product [Paramecium sonneborni]
MNYSTFLNKNTFPDERIDDAINLLVYGCEVQKIISGNKFEKLFIYMSHDVSYHLIYIINQYTNYIDLRKIRFITDDIQDKKKFTDDKSVLLQIFINEECWYLKFEKSKLKELWWQGLQYFYKKAKEDFKEKLQIKMMAWEIFTKFDEDRDGYLNRDEQQGFINWIKLIYPDKSLIENKCIQQSFKNKIEYIQFEQIVQVLYKQSILIYLNKLYLDSKNQITEFDFKRFLQTQKQQDSDQLFELHFPMTADKFNDFLFSQQNSIYEMGHSDDMTKPLSHYYINSSHNTYLTKDQLSGDSSVGQYIIALLNGCRCFELDCWDSFTDKNPVIYHGYTLTSKILFEDVIMALDKFGFRFSSYPIILSLELHCSIDQQEVLGQIMKSQFKDELYIYEDGLDVLPSPEKLKNKFLIKSSGILEESSNMHKTNQIIRKSIINQNIKQSKTIELIQLDQDPEPGEIREIAKKQRINNKILKNLNYQNKHKQLMRQEGIQDFKMTGDQIDMVIPVNMNVKHHPQFLSCISLFNSPFNFDKKRTIWHISSLSEDKVEKIYKEKKVKQIQQSLNHSLVRIYPSGLRVNSSNYDPIPSFILGAQIIALNFQTKDESMLINQAKFEQNHGCGYFLKPKYLINGQDNIPDFESPEYPKQLVTIQIISCQLFLLDIKTTINSFVGVTLKGNKVGENVQEFQTNIKYNNGVNPEFDPNSSKKIFEIKNVDQAIFIFRVYNKNEESKQTIIGQYALPFRNMRQGYRAIPLKDENLLQMEYCYIFAQISIQ